MKKLSVLILLVVAVTLVFVSCNRRSATGPDAYANAPNEVSVIVLDRGQIAASEGDYANNRWTRWANENSPVRVTFVPVPRTASSSTMTTMFASGTAPDLIAEYNRGFLDRFYDQGVIQPVDEYIERYSTAYKEYQIRNPDLVPFLIGLDGKQYGITSRRTPLQVVNQGIMVRKDWLDRWGMAIPITTDDALAFMRRARAEDPSGLGTWGVGTDYSFRGVIDVMFGAAAVGFNVVNGHFVDWSSTPAYRDALQFRATVFQEGLIDPEFITDTNFVRQRQFMATGRIAMRIQGGPSQNDYADLIRNVPTADFVSIEPLTTPYGKTGFISEVPFLHMVLMNKDARNPRAAIEFIDWMISDGYWNMSFGEEGRHYRMVNGVPQVIDQAINAVETNYIDGNHEFAIVSDLAARVNAVGIQNWIITRAAQDPTSQAYARVWGQFVANSQANPHRFFVPFAPSSPTIQEFATNTGAGINSGSRIDAIETAIMMGRISVDEGLRQINEYKNSLGWERINAEKDAWFQANRQNFQAFSHMWY